MAVARAQFPGEGAVGQSELFGRFLRQKSSAKNVKIGPASTFCFRDWMFMRFKSKNEQKIQNYIWGRGFRTPPISPQKQDVWIFIHLFTQVLFGEGVAPRGLWDFSGSRGFRGPRVCRADTNHTAAGACQGTQNQNNREKKWHLSSSSRTQDTPMLRTLKLSSTSK